MALKVGMTCGGCEAAVRRVLGKLDGTASDLTLAAFPSGSERDRTLCPGSVYTDAWHLLLGTVLRTEAVASS